MRGWEARRRGVSTQKKRNEGCAFCGAPPTRSLWVLGAGSLPCCDACRDKKMAESRALVEPIKP